MATGNPRCSETRYHDSHRHAQKVTRFCTGKTDCGERLHDEHEFERVEIVWCPGICDCGLDESYGYAAIHGPGEHK